MQVVSDLVNAAELATLHGVAANHRNFCKEKTKLSEYNYEKSALSKKAFVGWAWNFLLQVSTIGLSGAVFFVSSRYLSPRDFGIVAFAAASVALISAVMPIAFGQALVQRERVEERHLEAVFWLCATTGALAYAILLISTPFLAEFQNTPYLTPIVAVLGTKLVFDGLNTVPNAILQRRMSFRTLATRSMAANAVGALTCFVLIYLGAPIWGLVLSQAINPMVSTIVLFGVTRWRPRGLADIVSLRELFGFGAYVFGGQLLNQARIDQLIMGATLGSAGLGLYYFSQRLYSLCLEVTSGAFTAVSNTVFSAIQSDAAKRKFAFRSASFASTSIGFPAFTGLIVVAPSAVPLLFGTQWIGSVTMVQALSVIGLMATLGVVQGSMITYFGHARWWFNYQLVSQASGWLIIVLLSPWGASVVVNALAVRTIAYWPWSVWKAAKLLGMNLKEYASPFFPPATACAIMASVILLYRLWNPEMQPWLLLVSTIVLGAVVYLLCLFAISHKMISELIVRIRRRSDRMS